MLQDDKRFIEHTLQRVGLNDSDIIVFFAWIERWAATIKQLSDDTRMWRVTVHQIVKRLLAKWLFLETYSDSKRLVYPNSMDRLPQIVEDQQSEMRSLMHDAEKTASLLQWIHTQSEWLPKTRFYKWKEWVEIVLNEAKISKSDISILSDGQHFYELIDNDFLEQSITLREKHNITVRMIFPHGFEYFSYTQWQRKQAIEMQQLPDTSIPKWWLILWGESVAFHCYEGKFLTTTIMTSSHIANMMQALYDNLWEK